MAHIMWIKNWLNDRFQSMVINGSIASRGVPKEHSDVI